ncbi:hypothetical protein [Nocardia sp. NBC_01329]|uniref:hypothetical protein n=1 Tax=Nocardia sp. NBC_01329 TaxID=2903594 RepID=UPI002E1466C9|nr:hypothetical protein OG405_00695 [Nocardia sp. NBC_01329]
MSTGDQPVGMQPDALEKMGADFCTSAGVIKSQATKVADNIIGKAHVGAAYESEGAKIEAGLREVESWLNDWAEATELTGDAIGQDVVSMSTVDKENSDGTQKAAS